MDRPAIGGQHLLRENGPMTEAAADPHAVTRRITTLSVRVAILLIVLKAVALSLSGSVSILASLADSALDLAASLATFFAVRWAATAPDAGHPYGHGKAEGLAALVQSGAVLASAVFIGWEAIRRMLKPEAVTGGFWPVGVMAVSILVTLWLIREQNRAVKTTGSLAVEGDRAHYTADLASNIVVLTGVASGTLLAAPGLDAAAGLIVAVWLAWGAIILLRNAAGHLLDTAAPAQERNAVVEAVLSDDRISNVHQLRTRKSGQILIVQMHVDLDPALSLAQAHDIVVAAENRVKQRFAGADVLIHADPAGVTATMDRPDPMPGPWDWSGTPVRKDV